MSTKVTNSGYKWIEKNIAKIGPNTYRIRVGSLEGYAPTREKARAVKKSLINKYQ